jgi:hypothetical protein
MNGIEDLIADAVESWIGRVQIKKEVLQDSLVSEVRESWKTLPLPPSVTSKIYTKLVLEKMKSDSRLQFTNNRFLYIGKKKLPPSVTAKKYAKDKKNLAKIKNNSGLEITSIELGKKLHIQERNNLSANNLSFKVRSDPFALRHNDVLCANVPCMTYEEMAQLDNEDYYELYESLGKSDYEEREGKYDVFEDDEDVDEEEGKEGDDEEDSIFKWKGEDVEEIIFKRNGEDNNIQKFFVEVKESILSKLYMYFYGSSSVSIRDKGVALADGDHALQFLEASLFGQLVVDSELKGGTTEQQKIFLVKTFKTQFLTLNYKLHFILFLSY